MARSHLPIVMTICWELFVGMDDMSRRALIKRILTMMHLIAWARPTEAAPWNDSNCSIAITLAKV
jgi:hypothetical protein